MSSYVQLAGVSPWIRVPRETRRVNTGTETEINLIFVINVFLLRSCD